VTSTKGSSNGDRPAGGLLQLPHVKLPACPDLHVAGLSETLDSIGSLLKRDEADVVLIAGNVALVAFGVIEWPVAALALAVHAVARSRFKALEAVGEVVEEAE